MSLPLEHKDRYREDKLKFKKCGLIRMHSCPFRYNPNGEEYKHSASSPGVGDTSRIINVVIRVGADFTRPATVTPRDLY